MGIRGDIESGTLLIDAQSEDIHSFVETELTRRIGGAGKMLHTARSRNDQVALDLRLWLLDETREIETLLNSMLKALLQIAQQHAATLMPGMTHLQHAQPLSLGQHMMDGLCHDVFARPGPPAGCCRAHEPVPPWQLRTGWDELPDRQRIHRSGAML